VQKRELLSILSNKTVQIY